MVNSMLSYLASYMASLVPISVVYRLTNCTATKVKGRSSQQRCSVRKSVLRNSEPQAVRSAPLLKRDSGTSVFL